jgi:hypothetical protein
MAAAKITTLAVLFLASTFASAQNLPDAPSPKQQIISNAANVASTFAWAAALSKASSDCIAEVKRDNGKPAEFGVYHPRAEFRHALYIGLSADAAVALISHFKPGIGKYLPWISG